MNHNDWSPVPMYCLNCGQINYGYWNGEGKIKYECPRCKVTAIRVQKGRRHDTVDVYAPTGQMRYEQANKLKTLYEMEN